MEQSVTAIEVAYPTRKEGAFPSSIGSMRPRAQVIFDLERGGGVSDTRTHWVPPRVARAFERDLPELPCPYDQATRLLDELEKNLCLSALTEMLGRREYGAHEAERKLHQAGFRRGAIGHALKRAQELRFLDEERFLRSYIDERIRRGWGRIKIEADLRRRGADPFSLEGYPEAFFSIEDDRARASALLERKPIPEHNAFERLVRHLMSKGFSYTVAADAVRSRLASVEYADDADDSV